MIIANLWGSIVKLVKDEIITDLGLLGHTGFQFLDFDAHANIQELPDQDLIGPHAFGLHTEDLLHCPAFGVAVCTYDDTNLFRLRDAMDLVYDRLQPEQTFPVYDRNTLAQRGVVVMLDGTTMAPMSRAETRPFQFVYATGKWLPSPSV